MYTTEDLTKQAHEMANKLLYRSHNQIPVDDAVQIANLLLNLAERFEPEPEPIPETVYSSYGILPRV
ncbi:hypothetical protein FIU93_22755 [Labrenzia sp. THAF35]|uniref:hypothetical protein n=1 Tax=Labrenzia sp. THAF35 TaxID=2587854 RepID=UPI001267BAB9|nr:hypothetical protein [Labrenzia sp. THAF35]QFT69622.1 hypothetical protein FIU93_22755 [Labrenzia sp. THAF35]